MGEALSPPPRPHPDPLRLNLNTSRNALKRNSLYVPTYFTPTGREREGSYCIPSTKMRHFPMKLMKKKEDQFPNVKARLIERTCTIGSGLGAILPAARKECLID